ncbi:MAG: hypothetical protein HYZ53_05815 [Planctomycetes bacterium]|nr:hypothetical protein [Planctomycetota bacterium]
MRRSLGWFFLGFLLVLPLRNLLSEDLSIDDVIVMFMTGEGEEKVLEEIRKSGTRFRLTEQDLDRLRDAKVSERVIEAMLATDRPSKPPEPERPPEEPVTPPGPARPPEPVPPEKPPAPQPPATRFVPFALPDGRIGFEYPETWKPVTTRWGSDTITASAYEIAMVPRDQPDDLAELRTGFLASFNREVWLKGAPSVDEWEESYQKRLARTDPKMKLLRSGTRILAGREGMVYHLSGVPMGAQKKIQSVLWVLPEPKGVTLLAATAPAEEYERLSGVFERVFASVRFSIPAATDAGPHAGNGPAGGQGAGAGGGSGAGNHGAAQGAATGDPAAWPDELPSFLEFVDPDRIFSVRYPAGWSRANLVMKDGIFWFFSKTKFDPRAGQPFVGGVSLFVRPAPVPEGQEMNPLPGVAESVKGLFQKTQIELGSTVSISPPESVKLLADPGIRYTYDLKYQDGRQERGYLVVAMNRRAVVVAEANALADEFEMRGRVLLASVLSLRVTLPEKDGR